MGKSLPVLLLLLATAPLAAPARLVAQKQGDQSRLVFTLSAGYAFGRGGTLPTCEAIADYVYRRLLPRLPAQLSLDFVRISEDATLSGEAGSA